MRVKSKKDMEDADKELIKLDHDAVREEANIYLLSSRNSLSEGQAISHGTKTLSCMKTKTQSLQNVRLCDLE